MKRGRIEAHCQDALFWATRLLPFGGVLRGPDSGADPELAGGEDVVPSVVVSLLTELPPGEQAMKLLGERLGDAEALGAEGQARLSGLLRRWAGVGAGGGSVRARYERVAERAGRVGARRRRAFPGYTDRVAWSTDGEWTVGSRPCETDHAYVRFLDLFYAVSFSRALQEEEMGKGEGGAVPLLLCFAEALRGAELRGAGRTAPLRPRASRPPGSHKCGTHDTDSLSESLRNPPPQSESQRPVREPSAPPGLGDLLGWLTRWGARGALAGGVDSARPALRVQPDVGCVLYSLWTVEGGRSSSADREEDTGEDASKDDGEDVIRETSPASDVIREASPASRFKTRKKNRVVRRRSRRRNDADDGVNEDCVVFAGDNRNCNNNSGNQTETSPGGGAAGGRRGARRGSREGSPRRGEGRRHDRYDSEGSVDGVRSLEKDSPGGDTVSAWTESVARFAGFAVDGGCGSEDATQGKRSDPKER